MDGTIPAVTEKELPEIVKHITVERYTRLERFYHWTHVFIMLLFFFTGLELLSNTYFVGTEYFTQIFHFAIGGIIACWYLFFYLYFIIKYRNFREIFPNFGDFRDLVIILLCTVRILPESRYPQYDYYIVEEKRYGRKFNPGQKFQTLTNMIAIFVIGATGIVMSESIFPGYLPEFFTALFTLIVSPLELLAVDLEIVHSSVYFYFILTTFIHFLLAIMPRNRNRLFGMITGSEKIPISSK